MYDSTNDVKEHIGLVQKWIADFVTILNGRGKVHDASKLQPPEKECFDRWTPELQHLEFGSREYKLALEQMGEGLKHHYAVNAHHPEHHKYLECNGCFKKLPITHKGWCDTCGYTHFTERFHVDGMTLYNLVEMVCDWMAAAEKKGVPVDMDYLQQRFSISDQLRSIIENQFREIDRETISHNAPRNIFHKERS